MKTFKDFLDNKTEELNESEVDFIQLMQKNKHLKILVDEAAKVIMAKNNLTLDQVMDGLKRNDKKLVAQFLKLISLGMSASAGM